MNLLINLTKKKLIIHQTHLKVLSKRELEILPLIAKGYGNKEIAEKLFCVCKDGRSTTKNAYNE